MRNNTVTGWLIAGVAVFLISGAAHAAGLGRLTLLSALGQPLNAEVELTSVQQGATITARLASIETYQRHNLPFNSALAGTRVTVERRPNGQLYLRATTPRPVSEPFIELLIEINSEHGRVTRQYTLLLDPPGYGAAAGEISPPVASVATTGPPATAAPAVAPPVVAAAPLPAVAESPKPVAASPKPAAAPKPAPAAPETKPYGPVKPGETLSSIARSVKPEGVSLEQALVGIYRHNPDAFIKKNMNLVRSGKILQVPDAGALAAVAQPAARKEVRLHVADFNAYRGRLADRASAAPEGGSAASGRIGTRVADAAAGEGPRDTVRLSRGEAAGKGKGKAGPAERLRALEEEAIAREKALAEASARIAQLEKTIKDMQRLAELKGSGTPAAAQGQDKAAQPVPAAVVVAAGKAPVAEAGKGSAPDAGKAPAPEAPKDAAADAAKPAPPAAKAEPAPAAKAPPPPAPAPEPDFVDMLFGEPLYLAAGGVVLLLGGLGIVAARRRRAAQSDVLQEDDDMVKIAPTLGGGDAKAAALAMPAASRLDEKMPSPLPPALAAASAAGDNDLDFNLAESRRAEQAQARPAPADRPAPSAVPEVEAPPQRPAEPPSRFTEPAQVAEPPRAVEPVAEPRRAPESSRAAEVLRAAQAKAAEPALPDLELDKPAPPPAAEPARDTNTIEFNLEPMPAGGAPLGTDNRVSSEPPPMDFKLDLKDLDFDTPDKGAGAASAHDDHWYDVQQKFDLAKAYEEMGDKEGARDILQEVVKEGDAEQQAQAKKQLAALS